jgi:hypothetical protein
VDIVGLGIKDKSKEAASEGIYTKLRAEKYNVVDSNNI